jgi:hypothetical protein
MIEVSRNGCRVHEENTNARDQHPVLDKLVVCFSIFDLLDEINALNVLIDLTINSVTLDSVELHKLVLLFSFPVGLNPIFLWRD